MATRRDEQQLNELVSAILDGRGGDYLRQQGASIFSPQIQPQGFVSQALMPTQASGGLASGAPAGGTSIAGYERAYGPMRPSDPNKQVMNEIRAAVGSYFGPGYSVRGVSGKGAYGSKAAYGHRPGNALDFDVIDPNGKRVTSRDAMYGLMAHMAARNPNASIGYGKAYMGAGRIHYSPFGGKVWGATHSWASMDKALRDMIASARKNGYNGPVAAAPAEEEAASSSLPEASIRDIPQADPRMDQLDLGVSTGRIPTPSPAPRPGPAEMPSSLRSVTPIPTPTMSPLNAAIDPARFDNYNPMATQRSARPELPIDFASRIAVRPELPATGLQHPERASAFSPVDNMATDLMFAQNQPTANVPVPEPRPAYAGPRPSESWPDNWFTEQVPFQSLPGDVRFSDLMSARVRDALGGMVKAGIPDAASRIAQTAPQMPSAASTAAPELAPSLQPASPEERMGGAGWSLFNGVKPGDMMATRDRLQAQERERDLSRAVSAIIGEDARRNSVYTGTPQPAQSAPNLADAYRDAQYVAASGGPRGSQAPSPYSTTITESTPNPATYGLANKDSAFDVPTRASAPSAPSAPVDWSGVNSADPFGGIGRSVLDSLSPASMPSPEVAAPAPNPGTYDMGQTPGARGVVEREQAFAGPQSAASSSLPDAAMPSNQFTAPTAPPSANPSDRVSNGYLDQNGRYVETSKGNLPGPLGSEHNNRSSIVANLMGLIGNILGRDPQEAASAFGQMAAAMGANNPYSATGPNGMFGGSTGGMGDGGRGGFTSSWSGPNGLGGDRTSYSDGRFSVTNDRTGVTTNFSADGTPVSSSATGSRSF